MLRLLPWKFIIKAAARRYGVLDPATLLARLRRFSQPSEVAEPLELLRAGIIFHARGLVNAKVIQHNLDWVWPYWVERQFNPEDQSFIPRAFSFSHINLTHRNWTAVGLPGVAIYPIIDPRGLITPLYDGWSIDFWIITDGGRKLLPSKLEDEAVEQRLRFEPNLRVRTRCVNEQLELESEVQMVVDPSGKVELAAEVNASSDEDGWLAVAVRPYNPEGVQFIHQIEQQVSDHQLRVNRDTIIRFARQPQSLRMAHYAQGDVYLDIRGNSTQREMSCDVGMATGAALFRIKAGIIQQVSLTVSLDRDLKEAKHRHHKSRPTWKGALAGHSKLSVQNKKIQFLYESAMHTLILLSADELVPGPYTYRRFWFRDACLMLHPMLLLGHVERAREILDTFPVRQTMGGYFLSQEGEWDSNGQVLWIAARCAEISQRPLGRELEQSLRSGMAWLEKKRVRRPSASGTEGLLPAGFSAEHLGPNDYYYWDNYWAWAGLQAIAEYWHRGGAHSDGEKATALAREYAYSIEASILSIPRERTRGGVPAAPGRRMDAGAIGSMVADYPLHLYPAGDPRMMKTAGFLIDHCFSHGGFFQEMIHSGINAYLTLDLAQTLLRAGDPRFADLMRRVAELASPTGQWPEAIHPQTMGGCMGDGQHGWAAAEWLMMIRSCFVREESNELIIGSGILPEWISGGGAVSFGPTLTRWGPVTVRMEGTRLSLDYTFLGDDPPIRVLVPGFAESILPVSTRSLELVKL
jgi:hypothetical protein